MNPNRSMSMNTEEDCFTWGVHHHPLKEVPLPYPNCGGKGRRRAQEDERSSASDKSECSMLAMLQDSRPLRSHQECVFLRRRKRMRRFCRWSRQENNAVSGNTVSFLVSLIAPWGDRNEPHDVTRKRKKNDPKRKRPPNPIQ